MSKLKAKDPKAAEPRKPQLVIFGPAGVGKTWFALSFPSVYYIDTEGGASRSHYMDRLKSSGGMYLGPEDGANDFELIISQVKALATEKHNFKTLVIDSVTKPFLTSIAIEGERLGDRNAFGADKKPAVQFMRRLIAAVHRLEMNVVFVAHEKSEWGQDSNGQRSEVGKIPDAHDKLIYELDLALQVVKRGPQRIAIVRKTRLIGFPESENFPLEFEEFSKRYGKEIIQKPAAQIVLASPDQVSEINRLVELLKIDDATKEKWLEKANAETLAELNQDQATKVIESLKSKIK
jgi:hypothetical protein